MIIERLTLNNFGIFRGEHQIDLTPTTEQNIILIGGQNGAGKTTLLQAFKIALYGPKAHGLRNAQNKTYLDTMQDYLNFYAAQEEDKRFGVSIDFTLREKGILQKISFNRSWRFGKTGRFEELFTVTQNHSILSNAKATDLQEYLYRLCPPTLFDFLFFDGEEIDQLISPNHLEDSLRHSALLLFNLDLFQTLQEDLVSYRKKFISSSEMSQEEFILEELKQNKFKKFHNFNTISGQIDETCLQISKLSDQLRQQEKEFHDFGGLLANEREETQRQIRELELRKEHLQDKIRSFTADTLPFLLANPLLTATTTSIANEESFTFWTEMKQTVTDSTLTQQLATALAPFLQQGTSPSILNATLRNTIQQHAETKLPTNTLGFSRFLSVEDREQLKRLQRKTNAYPAEEIELIFDETNQILATIQSLRLKIETASKNDALSALLTEISNNNKTLASLQHRQQDLTQEKLLLSDELLTLDKSIDQQRLQLRHTLKEDHVRNMQLGVHDVIDLFINNLMEKKSAGLSAHFATMFDALIRKDDMVHRVEILPDLSRIRFFNKADLEISRHILSAGERQIFVLSLIWSLLKVSGRELPLICDSLLGRLDRSHKANILHEFLPKAGRQVIVLTTDTEIDAATAESILPYTATTHTIQYDPGQRSSCIQPGYFSSQEVR